MRWGWLFKSYSQWHALAFLLSELCHRTKGPTVLRAWRAVDAVIRVWGARVPTHKRDQLWRPLRKLMAKARAARDRELAPDNNMAQIKPEVDGRTASVSHGSQTPYADGGFTPELVNSSSSMNGSPQTDTSAAFATNNSGRASSSSSSVPSFSGFGFPSADVDLPMPEASPFFANQPQLARDCEWIGDPVNSTSYLTDILMGNDGDLDPAGNGSGSVSAPTFTNGSMGHSTPTALSANAGYTNMGNVMQPSLNNYATSPTGYTPGPSGFPTSGATMVHQQQQQQQQQQHHRPQQQQQQHRGGLIGDGPMVSGIDNDPSGRLPDWDDWNEMVRSFELETTGDESTPGATTPGLAGSRRAPVVGGAWF